MVTVHIENQVRDFDTWKSNFDKYEQFRAEQGVQSYRVRRGTVDTNNVLVDLEFSDSATAEAFLPRLAKIMQSPQAQEQLVEHAQPKIYTVDTDR